MGNKTDLFEEIRSRLANGILSGQPLEGVKRIKIGSSEEARKLNDYPIINISSVSGDEISNSIKAQFVDEMTFDIGLLINKKDNQFNTLYDTSDQTGGIYLLEKMLNVLDKDTSGNLDLHFNGKAYELRNVSWNIEQENEGLLIISVNLTVQTIAFTAGER